MALIDDIKTQAETCKGVTLEGGRTVQDLAAEAGITVQECLCALSKLQKEDKVESALVNDGKSVRRVYAEKTVKKETKKG